jgi:hypothetical protein
VIRKGIKMIDLFLVYSFIRRLATPFSDWDAYKLGIIDEKGNILKKRKELRRSEEQKAFGTFDLMILNIKKLLEKVPGGQSRLASYAAALFLIREWNHFTPDSMLNETVTDEQLHQSLSTLFTVDISNYNIDEDNVNRKMTSFNKFFEEAFPEGTTNEDAPTMSAGSGAIAGLGVGVDGEPPLTLAQQKKYKKKNQIDKKLRDIIGIT